MGRPRVTAASEGARPVRELGFAPGMRVGVFGGSFDPIHAGHVRVAKVALEQADLDRVLFLPTARPPHKTKDRQAAALERWTMVELALLGEPQCVVGDHEMVAETSYTIDTLERLRTEHAGVQFVLILGEDSFRDLDSWKDAERIVRGWPLAVYPRGAGSGDDGAPNRGSDAGAAPSAPQVWRDTGRREPIHLEGALHAASSSRIRELLADGSPLPAGWVPPPVLSFLAKYGLYRESHESREPVGNALKSNGTSTSPSASGATEHRPAREAGPISSAANESSTDSSSEPTADTRPLPEEVAMAARAALDRKAKDLQLLDVGEICDFADYFLLCHGNSDRQVGAIADGIQRTLRDHGYKPLHVEGERRANWILLDYGDWVAHIFDPPTREFYRLERLWSDAERVSHDRFEAS